MHICIQTYTFFRWGVPLSRKFSLAARVREEKGLSDLEFWGCVRFPGRNRTAVTFIFFCRSVCSVVCSRLSRGFHLKVNIPRAFPNRPCVLACIMLEGFRSVSSTPMSYEHICMMLERFKLIHSMQTHGLHVSHHMGKISACQQSLEMTCISLHKESESKRQQRCTMEKEKRKKPFQSI